MNMDAGTESLPGGIDDTGTTIDVHFEELRSAATKVEEVLATVSKVGPTTVRGDSVCGFHRLSEAVDRYVEAVDKGIDGLLGTGGRMVAGLRENAGIFAKTEEESAGFFDTIANYIKQLF